jgi:hypothetical protein
MTDELDGASTGNRGPKCEGAKCQHRDHQVGTEPQVIVTIAGHVVIDDDVLCEHGIGTADECSECLRQRREVHR